MAIGNSSIQIALLDKISFTNRTLPAHPRLEETANVP
jgi:hypothetical protein